MFEGRRPPEVNNSLRSSGSPEAALRTNRTLSSGSGIVLRFPKPLILTFTAPFGQRGVRTNWFLLKKSKFYRTLKISSPVQKTNDRKFWFLHLSVTCSSHPSCPPSSTFCLQTGQMDPPRGHLPFETAPPVSAFGSLSF